MSAALVPGCMRRFAFASIAVCSICWACRVALGFMEGDLGPIWISVGGGGLGSRGELGGSDMLAIVDLQRVHLEHMVLIRCSSL